MSLALFFCTTPNLEMAEKIASKLVEDSLAACVNIVPKIQSIYKWQGEICKSEEFLLLIKSNKSHLQDISSCIKSLHSYQVFELICLDITDGSNDYLNWLETTVDKNQN